jgi:hypothetical protein
MKLLKYGWTLLLWSTIAHTAQADVTNALCPASEEAQRCTSINFERGLPAEYYQETLRSVSNLVVEDFIFYLTESHAPFNYGQHPSIDYSVDFYSAILETNSHGTIVFVVMSSPTTVRPFGIIAIMSDGYQSRIDISFGYSDYAVLEAGDDLFFLYRDRFSGAAHSNEIR